MSRRKDRPTSVATAPNDVLDVVSRLPLFSGADPKDVEQMAFASEEARYPAESRVIREGRIPSHLYIVVSGTLEVWSTGDAGGMEKKVNELGPGDHFGEVGLVEGMPSTATVRTIAPTTLLRIPAAAFLEVAGSSPAVTAALIASVGGALARSHPTYQPSSASGALPDGQAVVARARELLASVDTVEREGFVRSLRKALDEAERSS